MWRVAQLGGEAYAFPYGSQDITTDGFGFMLSVGDLLWVPFTYSYTAYYLAQHPKDIGLVGCAGVLAVQLLGYWIFRTSNNEKNEFRLGRNPKSKHTRPGPCFIVTLT